MRVCHAVWFLLPSLVACTKPVEAPPVPATSPDLPTEPSPMPTSLPLDRLSLPPGFEVDVYAEGLETARSLALGEGTVFVGSHDAGRVYALRDLGERRAGRVTVLYDGLDTPNGVAVRDGDLYVAETSQVWRVRDVEDGLDDPPALEPVGAVLPSETWHGRRYIAFGPDGWLYIGVGAPCNVCLQPREIFATIVRMDPATGEREIFARGVRNTLGIDFHPETGELWFTENGRDELGENRPPDELNRAPTPGLHFGFPHCHGRGIVDPVFGEGDCDRFTPPEQELGPHVAALGMRFYTGSMFPAAYRGQIFIAEHGSWNRETPIGYRITRVRLQGNEPVEYEPFISGWRPPGEEAWGRPADVLVMPDGALLVSDDHAGVVYRVSYQGS